MLSVLPLIFLWLSARWASHRPREVGLGFDVRDALLIGAVATGAWGFLGAELLSLFHHFDRPFVIGWWTAGIAGIAIITRKVPFGVLLQNARPDRDRINRLLIAVCVVFLVGTGLLAFLTPTSTPDCLCYHLPRQIYWIQNHTVAHYPAVDLRQLEMPPLAEFIGAQLMLLSGNDHQSNLVQWFSYLIGALAASAIARDLGAGARAQSFAAVLALLNPAAASQSVNAKNDLVLALWILALIWAAVRVWITRDFRTTRAVFIGFALGLALLTKGTAFVVAPAICVIIAWAAFRAGYRRAPLLGIVMIVIAGAINAPHWTRNYRAFGSPIATPRAKGGFDLANTTFTPAAIASNLLRELTLHTNTPSREFNAWQERIVNAAHRRLGIDSADKATTPSYVPRFIVAAIWANDGNNPAPVHLLLGLSMIFAFLPRRLGKRAAWPVYLIPFVSILLFAILLKYQPCNVRLQIPIVASAVPVLAMWLNRSPALMLLATAPTAFAACCGLLWNDSKPVLGPHSILKKSRDEIMYLIQVRKNELAGAKEAVAQIAALHPRSVALDLQPHTNDYSVMRLILDNVHPTPRISLFRPGHGLPTPPPTDAPEVVIGSWDRSAAAIFHPASGVRFRCVSAPDPFRVYVVADGNSHTKLTGTVPNFFGWTSELGFKPPEGPYPQFNLPVVRWADALESKLAFESDGLPMALVMECRRNDTLTQVLTVKLNGKEVHRFEFNDTWAFLPFRVPLEPRKGPNVLTFEFANISGPANWAVLFRRLQVVPVSWIEPPPAKPAPQPTPNP